MFGIDFSEMVLIAIVALVVLGPERLPKVARTAGHLLGRLQRYVSDVKADINREIQLDELKKLQAQIEESARQIKSTVSTEVTSAQQAVRETVQAVRTDPHSPQSNETSPPIPTATGPTAPPKQP
ncbi:MAG TPA: Sec-independent protein translocase protein TatB [Accumulibacter sp.]|nr:Sec-independent protein translocase protein TatB [Accumulibacter sp.]HMW18606.1 Sec-independent protein translocase protein TatB [Accumulibacter sp.]HMX22775.1 Sec-independent protein translocase protein TatB [Accumulibacter sp.]HMY07478.1 Sec-independent protein translocase protein TatB [Accumulibacter sp.]HNC18700.1 Sec-independent protein translocase protein TatB [Accumulibacter sp.]